MDLHEVNNFIAHDGAALQKKYHKVGSFKSMSTD